MNFAQLLEDDAGRILQCPECENPNLLPVNTKVLGCPACGAQYPVDAENAVGALLIIGSDTAAKNDIKIVRMGFRTLRTDENRAIRRAEAEISSNDGAI